MLVHPQANIPQTTILPIHTAVGSEHKRVSNPNVA
jgi:hypothetical protein